MAEALSSVALPQCRFGLRILSWPEFPLGYESGPFNPHLGPVAMACELIQPIQLKKYNVLFRYESVQAL